MMRLLRRAEGPRDCVSRIQRGRQRNSALHSNHLRSCYSELVGKSETAQKVREARRWDRYLQPRADEWPARIMFQIQIRATGRQGDWKFRKGFDEIGRSNCCSCLVAA